jgi:hypothetical protein
MIRSSLNKFLRDRSGQALLIFTLASPVALGGAGMAVDVSMWVRQKDSLQLLADSAALAAASELARTGTSAEKIEKADSVARGFVDTNGEGRSVAVSVDIAAMKATVKVEEPAIISFGKLFGIKPFALGADSTASLAANEARACIISLDPAAKIGVNISGSGKFIAKDCWVKSHSTATGSITIGGSAQVSAAVMCASGGIKIAGTSATIDPDTVMIPKCYEETNPFASLSYASYSKSSCQKNVAIVSKSDVKIAGGVYCGGLSVTTDGSIEITGDVIIDNGPFKLTAKGNVTGEGVQIRLSGKQATFDVSGQGHVKLSARPGTEDFPGLVLVSDKNQNGNLISKISGGSYVDLAGSVYLPEQDFVWRGNSKTADPSVVTLIVAKTVDIAGTTQIHYEPRFEDFALKPVSIKPYISYLAN